MSKITAPAKNSNKNKGDKGEESYVVGWAYVVADGDNKGKWVKVRQDGEDISFREIIELWKRKRKQKDRRRRRFLKKQKEKMEKAKREQKDKLSA